MYDPLIECHKIVASPPYEECDPAQWVFGWDSGIATIEAMEQCHRDGRVFVKTELSSTQPMSYWG